MALEMGFPNGVDRTSHEGLNIILIGGGIGGLAAAIALRQQAHHVDVYEQSRFSNEIGAAIHMTPNAMGVLKHLGLDPRDNGAVPLVQSRFFSSDNQLLRTLDNAKDAHRWQDPWTLAHRAHLHSQLKEAAVSEHGRGRPVKIYTSSRVISVDPQTATIVLENKSSYSADVLIGADGVHSIARKALGSTAREAFKTHHSAFRFIIERKIVMEDPETMSFADVDGSMDLWYSTDKKIVLYPTSHNKLLNFACIHPASLSEASDDYSKAASKSKLLEVFAGFHPSLVKLLGKVQPADLKVYPLFDMQNLPSFVTGRMALIGDAAHPFTPHLAQGGAMALEDAVSLGLMLEKAVTPTEVPERLRLYNKARCERASRIQEYSRQVGGDGTAASSNEAPNFKVHEYIEYGLSHNEVHSSTQVLREHKWNQEIHSRRWRSLIAFGPLPGPQQDAFGNRHAQSLRQSTTTEVTVKFKTSATLLRNLFQNGRYSFEKTDTVAVASFSLQSLRNVAWLGGGGYDTLAFCIHGVCYKSADGQIRKATYCPIMFENLTDPILIGREELGVPRLFSDIDISRNTRSCLAKFSWRGAQWMELEWKNLAKDTQELSSESGGSEGLLVHKYIPSTKIGKADAEYDVLILNDLSAASIHSVETASPADIRVEVKDLEWGLLPTLHPVVSRLAELPIFEILNGTLTEYQGVSDLSKTERLR